MADKHPLEGHYSIALGTAIGALIPFLILTSAEPLFQKTVTKDLGGSKTELGLAAGLALAGYAFGALLAGDLTQRFRQRRLFLVLEALFTAGAIVACLARSPIAYLVGEVVEGFATGALLIAALPPVVRGYPAEKMPITAGAVDMGFFGAITLGPLVGGIAAADIGWRIVHAAMALAGAMLMVVGWLSLPDKEPPNEDMKLDWHAIVLAFAATALPFAATGLLQGQHKFSSPLVIVGLAVGLSCFGALLVIEFNKEEPLSPVRPMWNTLPVVGVLVAMIGGGIFVAVAQLAEQLGLEVFQLAPKSVGFSFWPTVLTAVIASAIIGAAVRSKALPIVTGVGMLALVVGAWLFVPLPSLASLHAICAYALLGFGAGATVSPGLWLAGFPLPSKMVGRTFALIELVRAEADFILAPVIVKIARAPSGQVTPGAAREAMIIAVIVAVAGTALTVLLYILGVRRLEAPDLARWLGGAGGALESPPLLARLRDKN